ncbi:MAG: hypothetical protein K8F25_01580 [Fimbriimonadaceae bacterium]|nr:hypothetical protein [Alphaproteobacteria bacterium]
MTNKTAIPDIGIRVGLTRARYFRDRQQNPRFDKDKAGNSSFLIPVFDRGDIIDLVAWRCDDPRWFAARDCWAFALGQDQIDDPGRDCLERPLIVHRTPENWLRSGQQGICIVRPSLAYAWLQNVPQLLAEDLRHGEQLERLLQPPKPETRILIAETRMMEAVA